MTDTDELVAAVEAAVSRMSTVRSVLSVRIGRQLGTERLLVGVRVGLPPAMPLQDVVQVVAQVQLAAARAVPAAASVYVEPEIAADRGTPTEAIVIRALE